MEVDSEILDDVNYNTNSYCNIYDSYMICINMINIYLPREGTNLF